MDPTNAEIEAMSVEELRKLYVFYQQAALYGMGRVTLDAWLAEANPQTPIE